MLEYIDIICQIFIALLGIPALFLSFKDTYRLQLFGACLGCAAIPFWWFTVFYHLQFGLILVNACYTYIWIEKFIRMSK